MSNDVRAECPVCGATEAALLYAVSPRESAQHFVLAEVEPRLHAHLARHIEALWHSSECRLLRCAACGFVRADPFIAGDAAFYELAYQGKREGRYPEWRWEYDQTISALRGLPPGDRKVLEIGAGNGAFVKRLVSLGFAKERIQTTEFSHYGRREIEQAGIGCIADDIRAPSFDRFLGAFDVLCLFQVLEHLDRLDAVFARLCRLARPRADIFIAVPNERRIDFNEANGGLLDMPPVHTGRWNRRCFEIIGKRHGLRVADHRYQKESLASRAIDLAGQLYLRHAQRAANGFANRIERVYRRNPAPRTKALRVAGVAAAALLHPPAFANLARGRLGSAQWVRLAKS